MATIRDLYPLTWAGTLLGLGSLAGSWLWGVALSDLVLLVAGFSVLSLLAMTVGFVLLGALTIRGELARISAPESLKLEVGRTQETGFLLRLPRWLPSLQLDWAFNGPFQPRVDLLTQGSRVRELVIPTQRGEFTEHTRRVRVRDGLGLAAITLTREWTCPCLVLPASGTPQQLSLLPNLVAGDEHSHPQGDPTGDRVDLRAYAKGDAPRTIVWKVFARSRKLMVKVPERAMAARPRTCAYLVATARDEAAAGVARDIVERDLLGEGWRFGADGWTGFCSDREESLRALARSAAARRSPTGLGAYLRQATLDGYGCCFVFLGSESPGPRLEEVRGVALGSPLKVVLCLTIDGLCLASPSRWRRLLTRLPQESRPSLDELDRLWDFWGRIGVEAYLLDRQTGGIYREVSDLLKVLRERNLG